MKHIYLQISMLACIFCGCTKYLDEKPDRSLSTPSSIKELQGLLDIESNNNQFPIAGELSNDNFYYSAEDWESIPLPEEKLAYTWDGETEMTTDWKREYEKIFTANVVLDELEKIDHETGSAEEFNNVKGCALFYRAINFYELAQVFAPPYTVETADLQLGIPLRTSPNIDEKTHRSTIGETYARIINDLKLSIQLLPESAIHFSRPGKGSAYALLARTCLAMRDYDNAGKYADSCLAINQHLINYNDLTYVDPFSDIPFNLNNKEILFLATGRMIADNSRTKVVPELYNSYLPNDLRKTVFFLDNGDGTYQFKGNYQATINWYLFCGLTTAEMYLTSAECHARAGNHEAARNRLNTLLENRFTSGTFVPNTTTDPAQLLEEILWERRKELCFRTSLRWTDLRRLNQEAPFRKTIAREISGQRYELAPNDLRYTFLIPSIVIDMTGIEQNPR